MEIGKSGNEITDLLGKEITIYVERKPGIDRNGNNVFYANPTWSTAKSIGAESGTEDDGWES